MGYDKRGRQWKAHIWSNGKPHSLGYIDDE
jgi:hypothetical protein